MTCWRRLRDWHQAGVWSALRCILLERLEGAYLYRAVDSLGQTIDFRLSPRRDAAAVKRFSRKALSQPHVVNPRTITVDKNPAYPRAVRQMKRAGELWRFSRLRQRKHLNNVVEMA